MLGGVELRRGLLGGEVLMRWLLGGVELRREAGSVGRVLAPVGSWLL